MKTKLPKHFQGRDFEVVCMVVILHWTPKTRKEGSCKEYTDKDWFLMGKHVDMYEENSAFRRLKRNSQNITKVLREVFTIWIAIKSKRKPKSPVLIKKGNDNLVHNFFKSN